MAVGSKTSNSNGALQVGEWVDNIRVFNGFYTPVPKLDLGLEYRFAEAERDNGADGSMNRLQFTTKYSF